MAEQLYKDELQTMPEVGYDQANQSSLLVPPSSGIGVNYAQPDLGGIDISSMPQQAASATGPDIPLHGFGRTDTPAPGAPGVVSEGPDPYGTTAEMELLNARLGSRNPRTQRAAQGQMQLRQQKMQEFGVQLDALKKGVDLLDSTPPGEQDAFAKNYSKRLASISPDLGDTFTALAGQPDRGKELMDWGQESDTLSRALQAGGIRAARRLLQSPDAMKTIRAEIDAKQMPVVIKKGQLFLGGWQSLVPQEMVEAINRDGMVTPSELMQASEWIKANRPDRAKLSFQPHEIEVINRNADAFYGSLGMMTPKQETEVAKKKAENADKSVQPPERTVDGKVYQWDPNKKLSGARLGSDDRYALLGAAGSPEADRRKVVEVELKLSDDYRQDSRKFSERRPLFDSATDYMANRNDNKTSAGDAALMFAYAKMRDPNDRIAVSDIKGLKELGNIFERFGVSVTGILDKGQTLPDRVAKEMYGEIRRNFTELNRQQLATEQHFTKKTKDYGGDPSRVVRGYAIPEDQLNPRKDGEPERKTIGNVNYVKKNGQWFEER